ncbi:MAG: hypothetical protein B7Y45_03015 [Sphingomonas sp. 28-66-16]|nr:MAG: hypothetical protein B7Y45_03015 [Sphingomonas sp. 28-66-16]
MPIALLLQSDFQRLVRAARPLDTWREVLALEALVIDRARGAFLSDWFGAAVPRTSDQLLIGIVNIEALGEQYRIARARSIGGDTGANLTEPVAGLAGMAAGLLLSPSGSILALYGLLRTATGTLPLVIFHLLFSTRAFGAALSLGFAGVVVGLGAGAAAILLPIGFLAAIIYIAISSGRPGAGQLAFELLGALARLFEALPRFVAQILGPRSGVRNPLIRSLLELFDSVAALMAQGIGAIALLVTRVGPLILPWTREFLAIGRLASATGALVSAIVTDARDRLQHLFGDADDSLPNIVGRLIDQLMAGVHRLVGAIGAAIDQLAGAIMAGAGAAYDVAKTSLLAAVLVARKLVMDFPLIRTFRALASVATLVRSLIPPSTPSSSSGPSLFGRILAALPSGSGPSMPTWPGLPDAALAEARVGDRPPAPTLANVEEMLDSSTPLGASARFGLMALPPGALAPFRLTDETRAIIAQLMQAPRSIVADQLAALAAEGAPDPIIDAGRARDLLHLLMGVLPADVVAGATEGETDLRRSIHASIAGTILPFIRARIPELRPMLTALDTEITARVESDPDAFPVRSLPDNGRLRPVIGRLTVFLPGGDPATARNFANDLTRLMREQPYVVAA